MAVYPFLLKVVTFIFSLRICIGQNVCDSCNCQITDVNNPQAIYTLDLICNSGSITWFDADGAIRLELKPLFQGPSRACFLVVSNSSQVKVTQELNLSGNYKLHETKTKVLTKNATRGEFCVYINAAESLHLFMETFVFHKTYSVPKIDIHYDIEKLDNSVSSAFDECRPCTKEEVLDAYCSMDYAVIASLQNVTSDEVSGTSKLILNVKQVIHQREPEMFHRVHRSDPHLTGQVIVPSHCGIKRSEGDFLMTGRFRLNSLSLKCAIYLKEWRILQHLAECSHDIQW